MNDRALLSARVADCNARSKPRKRGEKLELGTQVGRWLLVADDGTRNVLCACTCGSDARPMSRWHFMNGFTKSCGCYRSERLAGIQHPKRPLHKQIRAFQLQRTNAKVRGIGWEFTFEEWWRVWEDSGKWEQRGQASAQYCMGRYGDRGPYSPTNVRIMTSAENARERNETSPVCRPKGQKSAIGHGLGVAHMKSRVSRPYGAKVRGVVIAWFATWEEAHAAYKAAAAQDETTNRMRKQ